jgi:hypothetical protein
MMPSALIDEAMDRYVEWREECMAVDEAYARWSSAPPEDAELPFSAYGAALDREQSAAGLYRRAVDRLRRQVQGDRVEPSRSWVRRT